MTTEEERRRQALDWAIHTHTIGDPPERIIATAQKYYDFLTGKNKEN